MLRFVFVGIVISSFLGEAGLSDQVSPITDAENLTEESNLDPIITGKSISEEHKRLWKIQNEKYIECGLCGVEPQAFPGD